MRVWAGIMVAALSLALGACSQQDKKEAERKAGRAAYQVSQKTKEAARKAGRELNQAAKEAHQGWQEAQKDSQAKHKK